MNLDETIDRAFDLLDNYHNNVSTQEHPLHWPESIYQLNGARHTTLGGLKAQRIARTLMTLDKGAPYAVLDLLMQALYKIGEQK